MNHTTTNLADARVPLFPHPLKFSVVSHEPMLVVRIEDIPVGERGKEPWRLKRKRDRLK